MFERDSFPENAEQLRNLVSLSANFLKDAPLTPGKAYEPIDIPVGWLFSGKQEDPNTLGYTIADRSEDIPDTGLTEAEASLIDLGISGVYRSKQKIANVQGRKGRIELVEFQPAILEDRQLVPQGTEKKYRFGAWQSSPEGHNSARLSEQVVYSNQTGFLAYHTTEWFQPNIGPTDPLDRVINYLEQK